MYRTVWFRGLLCLALASLLTACTSDQERLRALEQDTGVKVLLVGIDGGTFRVLDPLVARGELPTFKRLLRGGVRGPLKSEKPMISPALWTTVVTGQPRTRHGIRNFLVGGGPGEGQQVVTSNDRRSPALWNILSTFRRPSGFVGWWATWPAEPVVGWMVSDRMTRARWLEWYNSGRDTWRTFPPELAEELEPLVVDPLEPPMDEIRRLARFTPEEEAEILAARQPVLAHGPSVLKFAYCSQRSYEEIALDLLAREQPDLAGVFLIANDAVSHTFWHYYEPEAFEGVSAEDAERLGELVPALYRHNDRYLARLLDTVDEDTVVLVVSDHGFRPSGVVPKATTEYADSFEEFFQNQVDAGVVAVGQSGTHHQRGLFLAQGGPIVGKGKVDANLADIAPTVLALLGLPIAEDMPGRVLTEILDPAFLERFPVRTVPSYEEIIERHRIDPDDTPEEDDALEMLRALGYIQ